MKIFSGLNDQNLTQLIVDKLKETTGQDFNGKIQIDKFSDKEFLPLFKESVRDEDVVFVNTTNTSDSIVETLLVVDAAKRAGCKSFTLVAPYQGYSRQDKTDHVRSSIGARMMADILQSVGISRLMTIDLHASSIQGFYNVPVIHLNGIRIFTEYIRSLELEDICIVSPDRGAVKRAFDFNKAFPGSSFALIDKRRIKPNEIHSMELIGDVTGKNVIIVDDMADTLGTLKKASELVMQMGAKSVRAIATHGILSGSAYDNLESSKLEELIVSDTIPQKDFPKLRVLSCAGIISDSILAITQKKSIHELNTI